VSAQKTITVAGSINVDVTAFVPAFPAVGQTIAATRSMTSMGGKGLNQAVAAARAGSSVSMIAAVGDDAYGQAALDYLVANNVDISHVRRIAGVATGTANILVDDNGDNMIAVAAGANARLDPACINEARDRITSSDALITQLEIPLESVEAALLLARKHEVLSVLNPAPIVKGVSSLVELVDVITPNASEGALLLGYEASAAADPEAIAQQLLRQGAGAVIITLGSDGCYVHDAAMSCRIPGLATTVVNPTGAGDTFNAVLTVSLVNGYELDAAARFAGAAGAFAVSHASAQGSAPTWAQIDAMLDQERERIE